MDTRTCQGCRYYEFFPGDEIDNARGMDFPSPPVHVCWAEPVRVDRQQFGSAPPACTLWDALRPDAS